MSEKILIVEDNDFVRMQISTFLKDEGYECIEVGDAREGVSLIDETFVAAVVDVRMEPMDGFAFIRAIHGKDLYTPIVLVTGDQNPDLLAEAGKLGVNAVLMKPTEKGRLIKMIERLIEIGPRRPD